MQLLASLGMSQKKYIEIPKILLKLKIMVSYIQNGEQIEYALLSSISLQIYKLESSKGKNCFKDKNYEFYKEFLSSNRNKVQIGLIYQENSIMELNSMINCKELDAPIIMYYLEQEDCIKLFGSSVFNSPENIPHLNYSYMVSKHLNQQNFF